MTPRILACDDVSSVGLDLLRAEGFEVVSRPGVEPGDLLVLYTDGVKDRFTADDYPGVFSHAPKEVVRNIVKRFGKDHDDAACIAVRYAP